MPHTYKYQDKIHLDCTLPYLLHKERYLRFVLHLAICVIVLTTIVVSSQAAADIFVLLLSFHFSIVPV